MLPIYRSFTSEERLIHFNGIYDRPLSHLGPYLIGIFFGFFSFNSDKKLKVNPMLIAIGWIVSFVLCILLMMSAYSMDGVDPWIKQSFATISHTFWSLVLLWICFATSSGYGGEFALNARDVEQNKRKICEVSSKLTHFAFSNCPLNLYNLLCLVKMNFLKAWELIFSDI